MKEAEVDAAFWADWDALLGASYGGNPMLESRFMRPCVEHFAGPGLRSVSIGRATGTQALLLLSRRRPGLFGTFSPSQSQIAPLVAEPEGPFDAGGAFASLPASCMRIDLFNVDPDFAPRRLIDGPKVQRQVHAVTMDIDATGSFEDYWRRRPKKLRDNMKRYRRRLESDGVTAEFRVSTGVPEVLDALRRYGELESVGWKGRAGTAIHPDNDQGRFYADVLASYAERGDAFVFELLFDGKLAASRVAIGAGSMLVMLKTTYDENSDRYAPGRLALHDALERLFDLQRFERIEFYTNAQRDQLSWADRTREILNLSVYRSPIMRRAMQGYRALQGKRAPDLNYTLECHDDFEQLPKAVAALWGANDGRSIFDSLDWYRNLHEHVGRDLGELRVFALSNRAGEPLAILPCAARAAGRELTALANYYSPSYRLIVNDGLIARAEALTRMLTALTRAGDWDSLTLFPLRNDADLPALESAATANLLVATRFPETVNWTQRIDDAGAYRASRPSRLRATLQRKSGKLNRNTSHRFEVLTGPRDVEAGVADFNRIYSSSWKPAEPYPGFILGLAGLAAANGWLRLGLLHIDDAPAAGQIWLVQGGVASIFKLAYDDRFRDYSPGTLLTMHLIEHVTREDGVHTLDYLTGDDAYKRDWMSSRSVMYRYRIANPRHLRGIGRAGYDRLRDLKARLGGAE